jgi:DNA anti-recombination protein RmuC
MASGTDERSLGNLEGRMAEQSALLHQIHADMTTGLQQVRADMTTEIQQLRADLNTGLQQVRAESAAGLQQLHAEMTTGFQQVNSRIDRLMLAMLAIGGGLLVALIGIIVTLIVQGG